MRRFIQQFPQRRSGWRPSSGWPRLRRRRQKRPGFRRVQARWAESPARCNSSSSASAASTAPWMASSAARPVQPSSTSRNWPPSGSRRRTLRPICSRPYGLRPACCAAPLPGRRACRGRTVHPASLRGRPGAQGWQLRRRTPGCRAERRLRQMLQLPGPPILRVMMRRSAKSSAYLRVVVLILSGLLFELAVADNAAADPAPSELYSKTIVLSRTEYRVQKAECGGHEQVHYAVRLPRICQQRWSFVQPVRQGKRRQWSFERVGAGTRGSSHLHRCRPRLAHHSLRGPSTCFGERNEKRRAAHPSRIRWRLPELHIESPLRQRKRRCSLSSRHGRPHVHHYFNRYYFTNMFDQGWQPCWKRINRA